MHSAPCTPHSICPHFGLCGGCSLQDRPYEEQLKEKEHVVREALSEFSIDQFHPILPSPDIFFYRNKMEFSFGDERDIEILNRSRGKRRVTVPSPESRGCPESEVQSPEKNPVLFGHRTSDVGLVVHLGLHPRKRFNLVTPTHECRLLSPESQKIMEVIAEWATANGIVTYTRHDHEGILRHVIIREGKNTGERMVNLFSTSALKGVEALAEALKQSGVPVTTLLWTVNDGLSDVARGEPKEIVWGEGLIHEMVGHVRIRIPPTSFMQTNTHASERMIALLETWVRQDREMTNDKLLMTDQNRHSGESRNPGRKPDFGRQDSNLDPGSSLRSGRDDGASPIGHQSSVISHLIDLYCGVGTIGLNLAPLFGRVIGVEVDEAAVSEARANAELNGCRSAEFISGRVENVLENALPQDDVGEAAMVLDPPRVGLHPKVAEAVAASKISHLYYVSCNPASLARDLKVLTTKYRIQEVQPMDFFPHTNHVETAVRLINSEC